MSGTGILLILFAIIAIAILFLKGFDKFAGRGPKQVKDGINKSVLVKNSQDRIPCPHCAELIMPAAKICPFCKSALNPNSLKRSYKMHPESHL